MSKVPYRNKARYVGLSDLVFAGASIVGVILWFVVASLLTTVYAIDAANGNGNYTGEKSNFLRFTLAVVRDLKAKDEIMMGLKSMWTFVGIFTLITFIQMYASVSLINSTDLGQDPIKALSMTQSWNNSNIFLILMNILIIVTIGTFGREFKNYYYTSITVVGLIGRGFCFHVVRKYSKALKSVI